MAPAVVTREEAVAQRTSGPAAAALLAAGIGCFVFGLVTTLEEARGGFSDLMRWNTALGPMSGMTSLATAAFFGSWLILHFALRHRNPSLVRVLPVTLALIALGVLGTLPTFFYLFASE